MDTLEVSMEWVFSLVNYYTLLYTHAGVHDLVPIIRSPYTNPLDGVRVVQEVLGYKEMGFCTINLRL